MKLLYLLVMAAALWGQQSSGDGQLTAESDGPPPGPSFQRLYKYTGTNLSYICYARSRQDEGAVTVTTATNANPAVFTATAHGFDVSSTPVVKIVGFTGNWAPANGIWKATIVDANSFSIPVDSTAFGAYGAQTPTVTTRAPRSNLAQWAIKTFIYDASNNVIFTGWAANPSGAAQTNLIASTPQMTLVCDSRASYAYQ